ncbi:MAG TPA: D-amino acid aminotransferase [Gammaproteobacteria bacterium]
MKIAYLNDEYLPLEQARVSPLDRGFLFADGVYEVIPAYGGRLFRLEQHLNRLDASLAGIRLANPLSRAQWRAVLARLVDMNGGGEQSVYFQVTRGAAAKRDHLFPANVKQTVFAMSSPLKAIDEKWLREGANLVTIPDIRWQYCHLKTVALLPNVLMRQLAEDRGADEAILLRDGKATECSASNVFIVKDGIIITPPKSEYLLPGITRDLLLELAQQHGMAYREREIAATELAGADEIWVSSSSKEVIPATRLDGKRVGTGKPGQVWRRMFDYYQEYKSRLISGDAE